MCVGASRTFIRESVPAWPVNSSVKSLPRRRDIVSNVLVTGGTAYVGCILVPKLLAAGHDITVYDLMLF
jgi:hypothetical protein